MEHISRHYVKSNTKDSGLMMWLKPGARRALKPELIHFGEVVRMISDFLLQINIILTISMIDFTVRLII